MIEHPPRTMLFLAGLSLFLLPSLSTFAQVPSSNTKPTASQFAEQIDQVWQKANTKFDPERNALLAKVDRIASAGPYLCRLGIAAQLSDS